MVKITVISAFANGTVMRPFRHAAATMIKDKLIPTGGTVLDIGANIGKFSAFAAKRVGKNGIVFSFEPVPFALRTLRTMVRLKRFSQIRVNAVALFGTNVETAISIPLKDGWKPLVPIAHLNSTDLPVPETMQIKIKTRTLDDFCREEHVPVIDFIKCDTEGAEYLVFSGARKRLESDKPPVMCEIYDNYLARQKTTPDMVMQIFSGLGYLTYQILENSTLKPVQGYSGRCDYLFIHPQRQNTETPNTYIVKE